MWILGMAGVCAVCFVMIPLLLKNTAGANAVYIMAQAEHNDFETPEPYSFEIATPVPEETPAPLPTPSAGIEVSLYLQLQQGDDYPSVETLQTRLMQLGYLDSDEPTTVYGAATANAVSLFQRTLSYDMNGVADIELQENLFSDDATPYEVKLGDSGADVESMQSRLYELGYYEGKVNGYFGVATEQALMDFQTKNQIAVDAVFHVDDRDLLYSPSALPKIDPTPTPTPKPTKKPSTKTPKPSKTASSSSGSSSSSDSGSSSSGGSDSGSSYTPSYSASYSADGIVSVACAMLGKPYAWSEESPDKGFDCSGLVYFSLRTCGVSTSRYSALGFSNVSGWGYVGSIGELVKGDLLFFKSDTSDSVNHTGIYCGGGKFVHASSSSGEVRYSSVSTDYWTRNFINGRRVF